MLVRKGKQWRLYPYKVKYTQHGEQIEQWSLPNKRWWTDFADKWEHTTIDEFIEIEITNDMQTRYEEIKDMPEDFHDLYTDFVLTGDTQEDVELPLNHPFHVIRLRRNEELNGDYLIDVDYRLMMVELGLL